MDDEIHKIIKDAIKNDKSFMKFTNISKEELIRASENSSEMVNELKLMKSKASVYTGVRVIDITKDLDGSMYAIASSFCENDKCKFDKLLDSGICLMNVNPLPDYHLREMIKHFMAYKSSFIALKNHSKDKKME